MGHADSTSRDRFRLRGSVNGTDRSFGLAAGRLSVGSGGDCDLVLDEVGVSRRHATLVVEAGQVTLIDEQSKNGTFVNGHAVPRAELAVGDTVAFGPVELVLARVHPGDTRLAVELFAQTPPHGEVWATETRTLVASAEPLWRWLSVVGRSLARSRRAGGGDLGNWLSHLVEELPAAGAAVLELIDGKEPRVLHTCGEVATVCHDRLVSLWLGDPDHRLDRLPGEGLFFAEQHPAPFAAWVGDTRRAVLVSGEFQGREDCASLLGLVFEVIEGLMAPAETLSTDARRRSREPEGLRFPPGYVRSVAPAMVTVYDQLQPLVQGDLPVLIRGETGVGKELIAQALHLSSSRAEGPFVAINCAAIPSELLEAELFGIGERVATGVAGRRGTFQRAAGGTLFLDEVGEMPSELQAKLLRVLQEKQLQPLGGAPIDIDVRVVSATNADIDGLMEEGAFRRDLYFRIAGYVLHLPPLSQRREDIPLLVERFLRRFCEEIGKPVRGLTVRALESLVEHPWPGNIRQLEHEIRRLVYLCPGGEAIEYSMLSVEPESQRRTPLSAQSVLPAPAVDGAPTSDRAESTSREPLPSLELEVLERMAVEEALRRVEGNQGRAAQLLGITRSSLRRRLKRHGL